MVRRFSTALRKSIEDAIFAFLDVLLKCEVETRKGDKCLRGGEEEEVKQDEATEARREGALPVKAAVYSCGARRVNAAMVCFWILPQCAIIVLSGSRSNSFPTFCIVQSGHSASSLFRQPENVISKPFHNVFEPEMVGSV